ncbi:MAG: molybdate ABC transporter permease subunit [Bacteroidales bacterium]|jgi:molybdate transport system permease protein|nr:molybdate ABC transporter permease subunit [Bacteroidales bacterium]
MNEVFFQTFWISIKLASLTTIILFCISIPIAYFLTYSTFRLKVVLQAFVSMPLVLPPSVLGFYLLLAFSPNYWFGSFIDQYLGIRLAFSFLGILIGSIIFNLPFMVNSIQNGFSNLPLSLKDASYTLGKSRMTTIFRVLLPNIKPALLTGVCLTFAHTIGEFGVILMIGGNIPGKTRVAALAVYDEVQALNFDMANKYAIFLFLFSFVVLLFIYSVNREFLKWKKF